MSSSFGKQILHHLPCGAVLLGAGIFLLAAPLVGCWRNESSSPVTSPSEQPGKLRFISEAVLPGTGSIGLGKMANSESDITFVELKSDRGDDATFSMPASNFEKVISLPSYRTWTMYAKRVTGDGKITHKMDAPESFYMEAGGSVSKKAVLLPTESRLSVRLGATPPYVKNLALEVKTGGETLISGSTSREALVPCNVSLEFMVVVRGDFAGWHNIVLWDGSFTATFTQAANEILPPVRLTSHFPDQSAPGDLLLTVEVVGRGKTEVPIETPAEPDDDGDGIINKHDGCPLNPSRDCATALPVGYKEVISQDGLKVWAAPASSEPPIQAEINKEAEKVVIKFSPDGTKFSEPVFVSVKSSHLESLQDGTPVIAIHRSKDGKTAIYQVQRGAEAESFGFLLNHFSEVELTTMAKAETELSQSSKDNIKPPTDIEAPEVQLEDSTGAPILPQGPLAIGAFGAPPIKFTNAYNFGPVPVSDRRFITVMIKNRSFWPIGVALAVNAPFSIGSSQTESFLISPFSNNKYRLYFRPTAARHYQTDICAVWEASTSLNVPRPIFPNTNGGCDGTTGFGPFQGDGVPSANEIVAYTEASMTLGSSGKSASDNQTKSLSVPDGHADLEGPMGTFGIGPEDYDDGNVRIQILDWHRVTDFVLTKTPRGASVFVRIERPGSWKSGARVGYTFQLMSKKTSGAPAPIP